MPSTSFIYKSQYMHLAFGQWPHHCAGEPKYLKNLLFGENGAHKTNLLIPNKHSRVIPQVAFVCGWLDCSWNAERCIYRVYKKNGVHVLCLIISKLLKLIEQFWTCFKPRSFLFCSFRFHLVKAIDLRCPPIMQIHCLSRAPVKFLIFSLIT